MKGFHCVLRRTQQVLVAGACTVVLSGCDQVRNDLAELIGPQAPEQALQEVQRLIGEKKYEKAKDLALARTQEPKAALKGEFAYSAARALALLGQTDAALDQLAVAMSVLDLKPDIAMHEPAFQGLQTQLRFLQIITGIESAQRRVDSDTSTSSPPRGTEASTGDTRIRMDEKGIEVRAGDVSVKLPN